jgi:galactokinase
MSSLNTAIGSASGRVAFAGEYLDSIFSSRAITCGLEELRYELTVTEASKDRDFGDRSIDNLRLVPALIAVLRKRGFEVPGFQVEVSKALPAGSGLGSSAAFAVAFTAAVNAICGCELTIPELAEVAIEAGKELGITGGKMDQYSAALGKVNSFFFPKEGPAEVVPLPIPDNTSFVLIDSGVRRRSGDVIDEVISRISKREIDVESFVEEGLSTIESMESLMRSPGYDLASLGRLVNLAHSGLRDHLKVSNDELEYMVEVALHAGAYGAKIIGAGKGGFIFALCDHESTITVMDAVTRTGVAAYTCTPSLSHAYASQITCEM